MKTHTPVSAELLPVNRGWYWAWRVVYCCSCGHRLLRPDEQLANKLYQQLKKEEKVRMRRKGQ